MICTPEVGRTSRRAPVRRYAGGAVLALALVLPVVARADDSFAEQVPHDVGLFVELRQADDLLLPLTAPQMWLTLAEIVGQPADLDEAEAWRVRVERALSMPPDEAIRTLFSQRVAYVGNRARRAPDALVLCRPRLEPKELLERVGAQPYMTAAREGIYALPEDVQLAVRGSAVALATPAARGMLFDVLDQFDAAGGAALADDATYRTLLGRVPKAPDGVVFARLGAPEDVPTPAILPRILAGSSNVLLALYRNDHVLHVRIVGDTTRRPTTHCEPRVRELLATLPERTLLAWCGHVDYERVARSAAALPARNLFRIAYQLLDSSGAYDELTSQLRPAACAAVGVVVPTGRAVPAPPIPAGALLVSTTDPAAAERAWEDLVETSTAVYRLLAMRLGRPADLPPIEESDYADVTIHKLDLSGLLGVEPAKTELAELHLCWALDDDVLIVASHVEWLRQVIAARRGTTPGFQSVLDSVGQPLPHCAHSIIAAQSGPIADLGRFWLAYFEQSRPDVLNENWWRGYQPGGRGVRLGIRARADGDTKQLRIESIMPGSLADGILSVGDAIIGCNERRFISEQPVVEMRRGLLNRPNARWIDLWVKRDERIITRRIPIPFVDPIEVLRRVVAIGQIVQRGVYCDVGSPTEAPFGELTLELRADATPLFEFPDGGTVTPVGAGE
jgi:hypothetical protein